MEEKRSELKVVSVAMGIIACQVLGIDTNTVATIVGMDGAGLSQIVSDVRASGEGGMWAAVLAGVYAVGRSYLKGRLRS